MIFRKKLSFIVLFFLFSFLNKTFAVTPFYPVISISAGQAFFDLENTHSFVQGDSLYSYNGQTDSVKTGIGGVFVGTEFPSASYLYAIELGLSYYQESSFEQNGVLTQGVDAPSSDQYDYQYSLLTRQLFIESKLLAKSFRSFHPYFIVGVGESFNKLRQYTVDYNPFLTFTPLWNDQMTQHFAYNLGVGVDADILSWVRMGLGYRYFNLGTADFDNGYIDTVPITHSLKQCLKTQTLMAQLTFIL